MRLMSLIILGVACALCVPSVARAQAQTHLVVARAGERIALTVHPSRADASADRPLLIVTPSPISRADVRLVEGQTMRRVAQHPDGHSTSDRSALRHGIRLERVSFAYPGTDRRVLDQQLQIAADELGVDVSYTWWAQRRGFIRNTLRAASIWPLSTLWIPARRISAM